MDNIKNTILDIKEHPTNIKNIFIIGMILIFFIVLYKLYNYRFARRERNLISKIHHDDKIKLQPLDTCIENKDFRDYILADFYVASSARSYLIGNQKYDYASLEMIMKVLQSGARYIELDIMSDSFTSEGKPIIAAGDKNGEWQHSLNSLPVSKCFSIIRKFGFKTKQGKSINHPLFIYINIISGYNKMILDQVAHIIKVELADVLLKPQKYNKKYNNQNIALEKICNLYNKVVIFASQEYKNSKLEDIVINTDDHLKRMHFSEVDEYSKNKVLDGSNYYATTLTTDEDAIEANKDELIDYNKTNLTIVYPNQDYEVFSINYNPRESWMYGCQFVAMNYQLNDNNIDKYINKFKFSGLVLKPGGLRLDPVKKASPDLNIGTLDGPISIVPTNYIPNFYLRYKGITIALETSLENFFLEPDVEDIVVVKRSPERLDVNNSFLIENGLDGKPNSISIRSAKHPNKYVIKNRDYLILKNKRNAEQFKNDSSFYPIDGICNEGDENDKDNISLISSNNNNLHFVINNRRLKLLFNDDTPTFKMSACFKIHSVPTKKIILIKTFYNKYITVGKGGDMFAISKEIVDDMKFEIVDENIIHDHPSKKIISYKLKANNNKVVSGQTDSLLANIDPNQSNNTEDYLRFETEGSRYTITNSNGLYLTINEKGLLEFKHEGNDSDSKLKNEKYFWVLTTYKKIKNENEL